MAGHRAWPDFRHEMLDILAKAAEEQAKQLNLYLLRTFFLLPYDTATDFYPQYAKRASRILEAFR